MAEERCCGCTTLPNEDEYDITLHVGAIFIIFAASAAGTLVPVLSHKIPGCSANSATMEAIKAFSFGVVLATGLIHMVNEGIEKLSDECLGSVVEEYGCIGLAIVLVTMMLMHFIECESAVFFGDHGSALHGHAHAHEIHAEVELASTKRGSIITPQPAGNPYHQKTSAASAQESAMRTKIATIIFEAGVVFHSVVVGLDLGVTTGPEFHTLLAALCFHQFFEGVAVGSAVIGSTKNQSKLFVMVFVFAITTPIGQAVGIAVHLTYSSSSATTLWVQGILDCVAGGILLYTGLVELLTYGMATNQQFLSRSSPQRFTLYTCLWAGAGLMTLIGKWA